MFYTLIFFTYHRGSVLKMLVHVTLCSMIKNEMKIMSAYSLYDAGDFFVSNFNER